MFIFYFNFCAVCRHPKIPAAVSPTNYQQYQIQETIDHLNSHSNLSHRSTTSNNSSPSTNSRQSQRSRRHTDSSRTSSLTRVDINDMYRHAAKQHGRKQNKTTDVNNDSNYADITIIPNGNLQSRDYGVNY